MRRVDMPLHYAAYCGRLDEVRALIAANAPVNAAGENGYTPLHYAIERDHADVVAQLIAGQALTLDMRRARAQCARVRRRDRKCGRVDCACRRSGMCIDAHVLTIWPIWAWLNLARHNVAIGLDRCRSRVPSVRSLGHGKRPTMAVVRQGRNWNKAWPDRSNAKIARCGSGFEHLLGQQQQGLSVEARG